MEHDRTICILLSGPTGVAFLVLMVVVSRRLVCSAGEGVVFLPAWASGSISASQRWQMVAEPWLSDCSTCTCPACTKRFAIAPLTYVCGACTLYSHQATILVFCYVWRCYQFFEEVLT